MGTLVYGRSDRSTGDNLGFTTGARRDDNLVGLSPGRMGSDPNSSRLASELLSVGNHVLSEVLCESKGETVSFSETINKTKTLVKYIME